MNRPLLFRITFRWLLMAVGFLGETSTDLFAQEPKADEFSGSYMQDIVRTYFNPDLEYSDHYLLAEAEKISAYIVQNAKDLEAVIGSLTRELMGTPSREISLSGDEYRRRLLPFISALDRELQKTNQSVKSVRDRIVFFSALGLGTVGLFLPMLLRLKKSPRGPKLLADRVRGPLCTAIIGCACGALLGVLASQLYGEQLPTMSEQSRLLLFPNEDDPKSP